ncbi:MAG: hypothetical protein SVR08_09715 [Spirochaetota bacterium]|nr:hypothetical protein [Spirochaetota bacterium]
MKKGMKKDVENRRKIVLINRNFQYRMISKFIVVNIIIMAIFGCFMYLFLNSEIESNLLSAHVTYRNVQDMLFPIILTLSIINIIFSSIIIGAFVLYASFRIAGPLFRFNQALLEMCQKNLRPFASVRKGDQLYECSSSLKSMSSIIADDFSNIKTIIDEINDISKKNTDNDILTIKVNELEKILNQYKF